MRSCKYLSLITVVFISVLLVSNVASSKIVELFTFEFDGGTLLFPLSYILGDVLTEVYGYRRARRVIWLGMYMNVLMALIFMLIVWLPAAPGWENQGALELILGWTPRIVFASIVAYLVGEFVNSYIMAKIKVKMEGRRLWVRTISSTFVAQLLDSVIFVMIAFYGVLPFELVTSIIVANFIIKVGIEVVFTPVTYAAIGFLKKEEGIDVYDRDTNFNPFHLKS